MSVRIKIDIMKLNFFLLDSGKTFSFSQSILSLIFDEAIYWAKRKKAKSFKNLTNSSNFIKIYNTGNISFLFHHLDSRRKSVACRVICKHRMWYNCCLNVILVITLFVISESVRTCGNKAWNCAAISVVFQHGTSPQVM